MTVDASGTLGRDTTIRPAIASLTATTASNTASITTLQALTANQGAQINSLFNLTTANQKEARRGIAAAVAMADAPFPSAPGRTSYAANGAVYRGQAAFSVALTHRLKTDTPFAFTAGVSHAGGSDTAVKFGVAGEF